jgi:tetratricopeptide (TPR) repeat protein
VGADDSAATALALFRMLDDRLNNGGVLRQAYEKAFPGAVFQNEFPADYRAWLTRVAKGDQGAMNPRRRAFFRETIGPDISGPLLPPNLRNVGPQTMAAIRARLEKQVAAGDADANLHRRLAAIYWRQGDNEAAGLQFTAALRSAPDDGETLFAAGMFLRSRGDNDAAADCFRWGKERATGGMWGIYCRDALANEL